MPEAGTKKELSKANQKLLRTIEEIHDRMDRQENGEPVPTLKAEPMGPNCWVVRRVRPRPS